MFHLKKVNFHTKVFLSHVFSINLRHEENFNVYHCNDGAILKSEGIKLSLFFVYFIIRNFIF